MNIEEVRYHCIQKKGVGEGFPFGPQTLVFKVAGKIFALLGLDTADRINLKCDPERAMELRARYNSVLPGYHMNKKHWNTVLIHEGLSDQLIKELIDHSYDLVVLSLPKKQRQELLG